MKPYLISLLENADSPIRGKNLAREYLQAQVLRILQLQGAMVPLAFQGGTALRFLYSIPRFSEDLDFALEHHRDQYDFRGYLKAIQWDLEKMGYPVQIKFKEETPVHSAFVRFPGLLYDLDLSPHESEIFSIKIEIDINPPKGAELETTVLRKHVLLNLQHYDQASLFAGKLHALLQRKYIKGRDVYDLMWYLSDPNWPEPNLVMLNNALIQTGWSGEHFTEDNWRKFVRDRIDSMNWEQIKFDVTPFIERSSDVEMLKKENLLSLL